MNPENSKNEREKLLPKPKSEFYKGEESDFERSTEVDYGNRFIYYTG